MGPQKHVIGTVGGKNQRRRICGDPTQRARPAEDSAGPPLLNVSLLKYSSSIKHDKVLPLADLHTFALPYC